MSSEAADAILDQIDQADLSATAYRTAIRLWRIASINGGLVHIELAQMIALCGTENDGTMRNHLYQIGKAGIIEYRAAGRVFVRFLLWGFHAQREVLHAERENDEDVDAGHHAQRDNRHAENDERHAQRENSASTSPARLGRLGRSLTNTEKKKKPTYLPISQADPPLEPMQQLALGLLEDSDVGVLHEIALTLVLKKPPQDIYRAVDKWRSDAQDGKVTAGVLKHRIEMLKPSSAPTVTLSAGFRDSELFHRHRLPDEMIADGRKRYNELPAEEPRRKYSR
jgi:hypothetical protein